MALGWDVERLNSWRVPENFAPDEPVIYGEPLFAEAIAEQLGLALVQPVDSFLVCLPPDYVKRWVSLLTAVEARSLPGPVFLKPPGQKAFPASVYRDGSHLPELAENEPVLVSEPVDWLAEFRFFIRDRKVLAWSPYWLRGELARRGDEWVVDIDFARSTRALLDRLLFDLTVELPTAVVIDAGVIADRGPAVVEANQASGAGIYGCDPRDVLEALRAATTSAIP
jgi:ATP-grasp domain, R2K clade family 2